MSDKGTNKEVETVEKKTTPKIKVSSLPTTNKGIEKNLRARYGDKVFV